MKNQTPARVALEAFVTDTFVTTSVVTFAKPRDPRPVLVHGDPPSADFPKLQIVMHNDMSGSR